MSKTIKIILSDTHLGAGLAGGANLLEDFVSDHDFARFLDDLRAESVASGASVELIINGDFVDMLQVPANVTCDWSRPYYAEDYEDATELGSAIKMRHITRGHPLVFSALASFISPQPFRRWITILRGNHDPELYWPAVQEVIRQALGALGDQFDLLVFEAGAVCRDGLYIEHGNQYLSSLDRFPNFEVPLHPTLPNTIYWPVGSRMVTGAVNALEAERYWIDNLFPLTGALRNMLRYDLRQAIRMVKQVVLAASSIAHAEIQALGRRSLKRRAALRQALDESRDRMIDLLAYDDVSAAHRDSVRELPHIHAGAHPLLDSLKKSPPPPSPERAEAQSEPHRSALRLRKVAALKAIETGARIVSFGHTHAAEQITLDNGAIYINTGTWICLSDFSIADQSQWRALITAQDLATSHFILHYARIDYNDHGEPHGRLKVFNSNISPVNGS
jgi:UDP-2,3-diacylglucosamine pyrophosphatase LpxH